jgi:alcohol-forming fatty acyl-CoA reductase
MTITEQFRGKTLLVTGTTGFLGKVLLEKLLFSLPEIEVVYVLIRRKKGLDLNERFKK